MELTRRDFVRICTGTVAGIGVSGMFHPFVRDVLAETLTGQRPPVFWVEGQGCTGCTVSLLNNAHPGIAKVLLEIIAMHFHPTIMAAEGQLAFQSMLDKSKEFNSQYVLIVEGSIPLKADGKYCVVGEVDHHEYTVAETTDILARSAAAVVAAGTCSSYGGVPAARGQQTQAVSVSQFLKMRGIPTPVINVPGCPPHPDWIVGTIGLGLQALATNTLGLLVKQGLDANGRPKAFYKNVHMNCPHLSAFEAGHMVKTMSDKDGCRFSMGCKGPRSACDSFERKWNNGVNWCVNNATCIGFTSPTFPDGQSPFYVN